MSASSRVLVIDDDPAVRLSLSRTLHWAGFDVLIAGGGAEGLRVMRADAHIRLVLLDLLMPEVDGWTLRRAQLADPRIANIPVVVVSGVGIGASDRDLLQAADYLTKPVSRGDLIEVVSRYCERMGR